MLKLNNRETSDFYLSATNTPRLASTLPANKCQNCSDMERQPAHSYHKLWQSRKQQKHQSRVGL
jgi:hypothetical protein